MMADSALNLSYITSRQSLLAIMMLVAVIVGSSMLVFYPLYIAHNHYDQAIEQLSERFQRYARLAQDESAITGELKRLQGSMSGAMLEYTTPSLAVSAIQAKVAHLAESLGGEVSSTSMLPTVEKDGFQRITAHVEMVVTIDVLQQMLYALESQKPYLMIRNIDIMLQRGRSNQRRLQQVPAHRLKVAFDMVGYALLEPKG